MNNQILKDELKKNNQRKIYDSASKNILSNKTILAHILKACTEEFKDIDLKDIPSYIETDNKNNTIIGLNVEDNKISGANIRYDLLFKVRSPISQKTIDLIINIEAQNTDYVGYPIVTRGIYHTSRLIAGQKNAPIGFTHSNYDELKKVCSIWICLDHADYKDNSINQYAFHETNIQGNIKEKKKHYDLQEVILLYPKRKYDLTNTEKNVLKLLSALFSFELQADTKIQILEDDYDIILSDKDKQEVNDMRHVTDIAYDDGMKMGLQQGIQQGLQQGIQQGRESGIKEGIEKGLVQGMEKGMLQGTSKERLRAILTLISKGISPEFILDLGYTEEEIKQAKSH